GRPVRLDPRTQGDSVNALREFHGDALADYRDRLARAGRRPTWWGRLLGGVGQWLGRVWGSSPAEGGAAPRPAPGAPEPARPARPAPEAALPGREARPVPAAKPTGPVLRSVCADRDGIHLVWGAPGGAGDFHATCPVDSPLGRRLQACYTQLEQLGYEVVGLEQLQPAPAKAPGPAAQPPTPAAEKAPGPVPAEALPRPRRRAAPEPAPVKEAPAAATPDPGVLPGL
ncbi:MAG TPA: hypothetical protein VHV47_14055, partial [Opitutaceae bacterium]|nr:hypothetical protein [Opitutaceae bacterium]